MYNMIIGNLRIFEKVNSIKEVKERVNDLHNNYPCLGSRTWDWENSFIAKNGKVIGVISFNGRVWEEYGGKEITD